MRLVDIKVSEDEIITINPTDFSHIEDSERGTLLHMNSGRWWSTEYSRKELKSVIMGDVAQNQQNMPEDFHTLLTKIMSGVRDNEFDAYWPELPFYLIDGYWEKHFGGNDED
jgi:hypothetical protein